MSAFPISGPLSLGDLLDRAFRLYRARFGLFVRTTALFLIPLSVISGLISGTFITDYMDALMALGSSGDAPSEEAVFRMFGGMLSFAGGMFGLSIIALALNGIVQLALTSQSIAALHGEDLTVGEGVRRGVRRFWPFVRLNILQWLAFIGATFVVLIPLFVVFFLIIVIAGAIGFSMEGDGIAGVVTGIGFVVIFFCGYFLALLLMILPTLYLSARWVAAVPALVDGAGGARDALRRSWALTQGGAWRAAGYVVLLWLVGALVVSFPVGVFQQILVIILTPTALGLATAVSTAFGSLFSVLWVPFNAGALVLLYYDLRVRKESYDLELRIDALAAQQANTPEQSEPQAAEEAPPTDADENG